MRHHSPSHVFSFLSFLILILFFSKAMAEVTPLSQVAILGGAESFYERVRTLNEAKKSIYLHYFIFRGDQAGETISDLLIKKRGEGLDIRVIVDPGTALDPALGIGMVKNTLHMYRNLMAAGVRVYGFACGFKYLHQRPLNRHNIGLLNTRKHVKSWITDGEDALLEEAKNRAIAIVGGMNIGVEYFRLAGPGKLNWRDRDAALKGPIVAEVQQKFLAEFDRQRKHYRFAGADYRCFNPYDPVKESEKYLHYKSTHHWPLIKFVGPRDDEIRKRVALYTQGLTDDPDVSNLSPLGTEPLRRFSPVYKPVKSIRYVESRPKLGQSTLTQLYLDIIEGAQEEILLFNAYFVPIKKIREALIRASNRGVKVKLATNGASANDLPQLTYYSRYYYKELVSPNLGKTNPLGIPHSERGPEEIEIYEWLGRKPQQQEQTQGTHHGKTMVVDRRLSLIGSYNLIPRSHDSDEENAVVFEDEELGQDMVKIYERDLTYSERFPFDSMGYWRNPSNGKLRTILWLAKKAHFLQ